MSDFEKLEYSVRQLGNSRATAKEHFTEQPLAVPVDMKIPETANQAISRILYQSGSLTQEQYFNANGLRFDNDYTDEKEDFDDFDFLEDDDEFEQSSLASFLREDFEEAVASSEPRSSSSETPNNSNSEAQQQVNQNGGDK